MKKCQLCRSYSVRSELRLPDAYSCSECGAKYRVPALVEWLTLVVIISFPLLGIYLGLKWTSWSVFFLFVFVLPFLMQRTVAHLVTLQLIDERKSLNDGEVQ